MQTSIYPTDLVSENIPNPTPLVAQVGGLNIGVAPIASGAEKTDGFSCWEYYDPGPFNLGESARGVTN